MIISYIRNIHFPVTKADATCLSLAQQRQRNERFGGCTERLVYFPASCSMMIILFMSYFTFLLCTKKMTILLGKEMKLALQCTLTAKQKCHTRNSKNNH
jgi:hypothetical protein